MPLKIAIVGRPNVGKSTLFNRLAGRKLAIVDDQPGVTRDRRFATGRLGDIDLELIDTAGFEDVTDESLEARMRRQTELAIAEADLSLFVIDSREGVAPLDEVFESFDPAPIASGSIAQIHRATLHRREVAVKVRHPRVVSRIVTDFTLMRLAAEVSSRVPGLSYLNLKASVGQFSETMVAQTRLDIEAEHIRRFGWNFGGTAYRDVRFPEAILATRSVRAAAAQFVGAQFVGAQFVGAQFFCAIRHAILRRLSPCVCRC